MRDLPYRPKSTLYSWQHGNDFAHIVVGNRPDERTFTIHRDLLARASRYFDKRLSLQNDRIVATLSLPDHCPAVFEVIYQYLYTGNLHDDDFYMQDDTPSDVFWLRAFRLARFTDLHDLASCIHNIFITDIFGSKTAFQPSRMFINALYRSDIGTLYGSDTITDSLHQLRDFIVAQTAYFMYDSTECVWSPTHWDGLFADQPAFAVRVLQQMGRLKSDEPGTCSDLPVCQKRFAQYGWKETSKRVTQKNDREEDRYRDRRC